MRREEESLSLDFDLNEVPDTRQVEFVDAPVADVLSVDSGDDETIGAEVNGTLNRRGLISLDP